MPRLGPRKSRSHLELAATVVNAYVSNNSIAGGDLPDLITKVHETVSGLAKGKACEEFTAEPLGKVVRPTAAQIFRSVRHDGIVSFIDGRTYKTLKRHLTAHGLHSQSYRERFGLPADYPMVAPEYAARRSMLAKQLGSGQSGATVDRGAQRRVA